MKRFISLSSFLSLTIVVIVILRAYIALTRYVDPDEFAHLHWAYLLSSGKVPYKDFFINFTPVFFWILQPVVTIVRSEVVVISARLLQLMFLLALTFSLYQITLLITKNKKTGLLAGIIFLIFPMMFDKTIEIRHDTFMTLLFVVAFNILLVVKRLNYRVALGVGVIVGCSIAIGFKIAYGIPSVMLLLLFRSHKSARFTNILWFTIGFLLPILFVLGYLVATDTFFLAWENIIHGSFLIKQGEGAFSPFKSWSPYPLVYVNKGGISIPWIVNSALWLTSIGGLIILFKKHIREAILFTTILGIGISSLFIFPTPYLQYFLCLSVFISILVAVSISYISSKINSFHYVLSIFFMVTIVLTCVISFGIQFSLRTGSGADNREQLTVIKDILAISKPNESVYDMVGSYIFRPDGYYICCNVYSQFANQLKLPIPDLSDSLIANNTKFIILDRGGKSLWLPYPEDLAYLKTNFLPSHKQKIYTLGLQFSCHSKTCKQEDIDHNPVAIAPNTFTTPITELYALSVTPAGELITIDGNPVASSSISLSKGLHTLTPTANTLSLKIQLKR